MVAKLETVTLLIIRVFWEIHQAVKDLGTAALVAILKHFRSLTDTLTSAKSGDG